MPSQLQVSMVFIGVPFPGFSGFHDYRKVGSRAGQPAHAGNCRADTIVNLIGLLGWLLLWFSGVCSILGLDYGLDNCNTAYTPIDWQSQASVCSYLLVD